MKQKEYREILFKKNKPEIRDVVDEDMGWLWAAHKKDGGEGDQDKFIEQVMDYMSTFDQAVMLEDHNSSFKGGVGPVGIISAMYNGWIMEPHVEWFPWATMRNKLRCSVAFFMKTKYSDRIGVCIIHTTKDDAVFFRKIKKYAPIYSVSKIPYGRMDGDDYLFYVRGRQK